MWIKDSNEDEFAGAFEETFEREENCCWKSCQEIFEIDKSVKRRKTEIFSDVYEKK
jgi:hypothetical protein